MVGVQALGGQAPVPGTAKPLAPPGDSSSGGQGQTVGGIPCGSSEVLVYHEHAHLTVIDNGTVRPVPAYVGMAGAPPLSVKCLYWLHTHDASGLLHMEAPSAQGFTLGQFFDIWGYPLTSAKVVNIPVSDGKLWVYVDGRPYTGDMRAIRLQRHTQVVIEIGKQVPPPTFDFGDN